jgi:hypothetical protein
VKTTSGKWLGNADTFADFFFPTSQLPEVPLVSGGGAPTAAAAAAAAPNSTAGGIVGPSSPLDADK